MRTPAPAGSEPQPTQDAARAAPTAHHAPSTPVSLRALALYFLKLGAFGFGGDASAKTKKVSYDQAWKICKDQMDKDRIPGTTGQSNERYTRGAACMKKYGYKI